MQPVSLAQIAEATSGILRNAPDPSARVTGRAVIDSRAVHPGDLFAAFTGTHSDGHEFAGAAIAGGAAAVLASRAVPAPAVVVPDVTAALGALAACSARAMTGTARVAVTGSSGKTSCKDLLARLLPGLGETVATEGSRNNEIGVPLTVLSASAATRYIVLEMGARGIGHLAYLTRMVPPDVSVVLNVGDAHVGEFGSLDATAQAKGELVEALPGTGLAVLNADDDRVAKMARLTRASVVTFGCDRPADVRARDVRLDDLGRPSFRLCLPEGDADVTMRLIGRHHVYNALAAAAAACTLGMPADEAAARLSSAAAVTGSRMQLTERPDGVRVIDDAYNANPDSMRAALRALAAVGTAGRRVAVLGEMKELGRSSAARHRAVGETAGRLGIDVVIAVGGGDAAQVAAGAGDAGSDAHTAPDPAAARTLLDGFLSRNDVVLVKASLAAGLQELAASLAAGSMPSR